MSIRVFARITSIDTLAWEDEIAYKIIGRPVNYFVWLTRRLNTWVDRSKLTQEGPGMVCMNEARGYLKGIIECQPRKYYGRGLYIVQAMWKIPAEEIEKNFELSRFVYIDWDGRQRRDFWRAFYCIDARARFISGQRIYENPWILIV